MSFSEKKLRSSLKHQRSKSPGRRLTDGYTRRRVTPAPPSSLTISGKRISQDSLSYISGSVRSVQRGSDPEDLRPILNSSFYNVTEYSSPHFGSLEDRNLSLPCDLADNESISNESCRYSVKINDSDTVDTKSTSSYISSRNSNGCPSMVSSNSSDFKSIITTSESLLGGTRSNFSDSNEASKSKPSRRRRLREKSCAFLRKICTIFMCISIILLFLALVTISYSLLSNYYLKLCEIQRSAQFPLNDIRGNLSTCTVGQEFSLDIISQALEEFEGNSDVDNIGILWFIGPIGVGKTKSAQIIENTISTNVKVDYVIASLLPSSPDVVKYQAELLAVNSHLCLPNLVILDGYDEEHSLLDIFLKSYIDKFIQESIITNRKVIILILGSYQSQTITLRYLQHVGIGTKVDFDYNSLRLNLKNILYQEEVRFISDNARIVPFLPIDKLDLEKCVMLELNYILCGRSCDITYNKYLKRKLIERNITLEHIIDSIVKLSKWFPSDSQLIVSSGCKHVGKLVSLFVSPSKV